MTAAGAGELPRAIREDMSNWQFPAAEQFLDLVFFASALPEIFLLAATCALMIVDLYVKSERRSLSYVLAQLILLGCAALTALVSLRALAHPVYAFNGLFVSDQMANLLKLMAYLSVAMVLSYSREYLLERHLLKGEFFTLLLFALLGIVEGDDPLAQMDGQIRKRRTLEAIKRILLRESLNQPLMVIFEDLHWIDDETQVFFNLLTDSIANAKILLLVNHRPVYSHQWNSKTY